jgi:hypothetical protein
MRKYTKYHQLKDAPYPVFKFVHDILLPDKKSYAEALQEASKSDIEEKDFLEWAMGGFIYVLEELEDLEEIETNIEHPVEDRWLTLRETGSAFDAVDILEGGWIAIHNITNNSGGPTYFIPDWMKQHTHYIDDSIQLSEQ